MALTRWLRAGAAIAAMVASASVFAPATATAAEGALLP